MIALIAPLLLRIGIPARLHRWVTYIALAAVCAALVVWWFARHDAAVIERHEEAVTAEAERKDTAGDTAARETATAEKSKIEQENINARNAADGSSDPLKSGLDSLHP